jgi:hypothetical protein
VHDPTEIDPGRLVPSAEELPTNEKGRTYPGEHQSGKEDTRTRAREEHVGRYFSEEVALKNPAREIFPLVLVTESKVTDPRDLS